MFTSSIRARAHDRLDRRGIAVQQAVSPASGSDSCYGVRSLEGSCVEWEGEVRPIPEQVEAGEGVMGEDQAEELVMEELREALDDQNMLKEDTSSTLAVQSPSTGDEGATSAETDDHPPEDPTRTIRPANLALPRRAPSPAFLLPTLSTSPLPSPSSSAPPSPPANSNLESPPDILSAYSSDTDDHSAPPSPTSQTSLPSYLASEMSMSMPSSPGLGYSTDESIREGAVLQALQRERARSGVGSMLKTDRGQGNVEEAEEQDIVIPVLSLPSSSLHLSFRAYEGVVEGVKIALVGDISAIRAFLRALGEREDLVNLGKSGVGLIRDGKLEVVFILGFSEQHLKQKVDSCYVALNTVLPSSGDIENDELRERAVRYAEKENWVHAYIPVGGLETESDTRLDHLLPCLQVSTRHVVVPSTPYSPDIPRLDDPTPLAPTESSSYFTHPVTHPSETPHSPSTPSPDSAVSAFLAALDPPTIISTSVDRFLTWRPAPLESSQSSLEPLSAGTGTFGLAGSEGDVPPMPTVARARGGGEWEAGLSRRVAKRRESGGITEGDRKRKSKASIDSTPLFPPCSNHEQGNMPKPSAMPGLGAMNLLEKTFRPLREGMRGWKGVLVMATIMGVMGWGWWVSAR